MRDCLSRFGGTMYGTQPRGFPFDNFNIPYCEVVYNAKFKNEVEKTNDGVFYKILLYES